MDNINKIHIGDNSVNKLLFASPIMGKHGDALWSYFKFAKDDGGCYVHGLWLAPINGGEENHPYAWPWDLGVPSGALKDVNDEYKREIRMLQDYAECPNTVYLMVKTDKFHKVTEILKKYKICLNN